MNHPTKTCSMLMMGAAFLLIPCLTMARGPGDGVRPGGGGGTVLDINEEAHLEFMRAEEKLAHDVYVKLGDEFPDFAFSNIEDSETSHTNTMIDALARFNLDDPNVDDAAGEFAEEAGEIVENVKDSAKEYGKEKK